MNNPELLLPVGTRDMLESAINNGADAVYYGVPHWNARGRTEDFSFEDVEEMIRYARLRGVKTYLAMNILIFEREIQELPEFLERLIALKPDAFIIQDIGLARLIKAISPEQEIHASTQMTLASSEAVNLVKDIGFSRAVLARELSTKQIAQIKSLTDLELEVFIHGALCVSYSGQCLTSENFGGRSANRGQCAQSCRLPYRIFVDGKEWKDPKARYLFSTRDLCALPKLEELREIGVESLKVEGRLKSPEYVAAVSHAYRKALEILSEKGYKENAECANGNAAELTAQDLEPLEVLFSRGLNTGWLDGVNHQELVDGSFSNHHGEFIGTVVQVDRNGVIVELEDKPVPCTLLPGDGILFEEYRAEPEPRQTGSRLYKATFANRAGKSQVRLEFGREFNLRKVSYGMKAYRNDSPALEKELHKTFTDKSFAKHIPVCMTLEGKIGEPLKLTICESTKAVADETRTVTVEGAILEASRNEVAPDALQAIAKKELSGLSATAYILDKLEIKLPANAFLPGKVLRTLRQEAVQAFDEKRLQWKELAPSADNGRAFLHSVASSTSMVAGNPDKATGTPKNRRTITVLVRRPEQIDALQGLDIDKVIMDFDWGVKYDEPLERIHKLGFEAGIATLRIHKPSENHYIKQILTLMPEFALVRNLGSLALLKDSGIPMVGDYSLNATNSASYDWLLAQGLEKLHPSWDLNSTQLFDLLKNIDGSKLELALHQYMPAFHSEYCAFARALTTGRRFPECKKICTQHKVEILDHKGERHFLQSDAECRNTLFVGKPQSALKLLPRLIAQNVSSYRLELLDEEPESVRRKIDIYTQAIRGKLDIDTAISKAGVEEKYGLSEGQLFNQSVWQDRKKGC
ncbi:peptidase U32 [Fibrobacter succinogenes subsp. succinogenes S85]|uniref:Peptidase U32 n=1 Tax=Fibrobacter succinogenes (strain ATCC 19169 / S85) TaxID=59374 RepID=A0ABN3YQW7_FIBSS|nr:U32 family peptidase [Fibrobacter succinogenes]ACX73651.1 peptidase U32 [Fibrobacter succinogenes subsp. succinogenes S85]